MCVDKPGTTVKAKKHKGGITLFRENRFRLYTYDETIGTVDLFNFRPD